MPPVTSACGGDQLFLSVFAGPLLLPSYLCCVPCRMLGASRKAVFFFQMFRRNRNGTGHLSKFIGRRIIARVQVGQRA